MDYNLNIHTINKCKKIDNATWFLHSISNIFKGADRCMRVVENAAVAQNIVCFDGWRLMMKYNGWTSQNERDGIITELTNEFAKGV